MVFRLFSIFCNIYVTASPIVRFGISHYPYRHFHLSVSTFPFTRFGVFNYPFRHLPLSVSASPIIRFDISIYLFRCLHLSVPASCILRLGISNYPFRAASSKSGRFTLKNVSLTNIYKRTHRINGTLNVYFQADKGDVF
jgi:hypothetical protein